MLYEFYKELKFLPDPVEDFYEGIEISYGKVAEYLKSELSDDLTVEEIKVTRAIHEEDEEGEFFEADFEVKAKEGDFEGGVTMTWWYKPVYDHTGRQIDWEVIEDGSLRLRKKRNE